MKPNKTQVTKETAFKNFTLSGVKSLNAEKVTTTFKVTRELDPKTNRPLKLLDKREISQIVMPISFELIEVTAQRLAEFRRDGISSFVLKNDGKLFWAEVPKDINIVSANLLGTHQCAAAGSECRRLSAASDPDGCAKVRNYAQVIERYPWITTGYETFNTKQDAFVVSNCLHYEKCPPRKHLSMTDVNKARLALAQNVWPDVTSLAEVRARKDSNRSRYISF